MTNCSISESLIDFSIENDALLELSVYIKLKSLFSNSCIYNASFRNLRAVTGISINTLKRTIKPLVALGWARWHGKNLVLVPINEADRSPGRKKILRFKVKKGDTYKDIFKLLRVLLVKFSELRFNYIRKISNDNLIGNNLKDIRKRKVLYRRISENCKFSMSTNKFGKMINRSKSTACRAIIWAEHKGLLMRQTNIKRTDRGDERGFASRGGVFLKRSANFINFSVCLKMK